MNVRRRIVLIRRRVAAVAVAVFIALFATIYVQMASGNDPALGSTKTTSTSQSTPSTTTTPSPMTTRQS
jgi:hypothetical protein